MGYVKNTKAALKLDIVAQPIGPRFAILVNGHRVLLTLTSLKYLLRLINGRIVNAERGGWIPKKDIDDIGENHSRYLYRMQKEIREGLKGNVDIWPVIYENNRANWYRLVGDICFDFNWEYLADLGDHDLLQMLARIRAKVGSGK